MPVTCAWSTRVAGRQVEVEWQASQPLLEAMWVGFLPVAVVPLWQAKQVPVTCVWSTRVTGFQAIVAWQDSQLLLVVMCVGFLPVACVPLWQDTQLPVTPLWLKFAGFHAVVRWQVSQLLSLATWPRVLAGRDRAVVAGEAAADHLRVVDAGRRLPGAGRVAGLAAVGGRDVRRCSCRWPACRCGRTRSCR